MKLDLIKISLWHPPGIILFYFHWTRGTQSFPPQARPKSQSTTQNRFDKSLYKCTKLAERKLISALLVPTSQSILAWRQVGVLSSRTLLLHIHAPPRHLLAMYVCRRHCRARKWGPIGRRCTRRMRSSWWWSLWLKGVVSEKASVTKLCSSLLPRNTSIL